VDGPWNRGTMTALSSPLRRARRTRTFSVHFSAFVCATLVVAVVMGIVNGARVYFYCPAMEQAALADCCEHASDVDSATTPREARLSAACCEARRFGKLAPGVEAQRPAPLNAPLTAILPAVSTTSPTIVEPSHEPSQIAARAGPAPPSTLRAKLQVYLC